MKLKTFLLNKETDSYEEIGVECEVFNTPIIDFAIFQKSSVFMAFELKTGRAFGVGPHETLESCYNRSIEMINMHGADSFKRVMKNCRTINRLPA